jgi:hypothetical protein
MVVSIIAADAGVPAAGAYEILILFPTSPAVNGLSEHVTMFEDVLTDPSLEYRFATVPLPVKLHQDTTAFSWLLVLVAEI